MDKKTVTMLMEQNLDTVKTFVQLMFNDIKSEVDKVKEENSELKRSLQYSQEEIADLKETVSNQNAEIKKLKENSTENEALEERIRILDDTIRKNNVYIEGIPEIPQENLEQTQKKIQSVVVEKLGLNFKITSANRIGNNASKPRPIIARFNSFSDRQNCLKATPKLKGTDIYISEDVCKRTLDIRKTKLPELKEKRKQGFIAYFSGCNLVVKRRSEGTGGQFSQGQTSGTAESAAGATRSGSSTPVLDAPSNNSDTHGRNLRQGKKPKNN